MMMMMMVMVMMMMMMVLTVMMIILHAESPFYSGLSLPFNVSGINSF